jgi:hypothetical protein
LRKFLASLGAQPTPVLLDLGPVVGSNVSFFGEELGCKIFVQDLYADLDRHARSEQLEAFPGFVDGRFTQADDSVDGVLCWDLLDYLDRPSAEALAAQVTRVLRPGGAAFVMFGTAPPTAPAQTRFLIADQDTLRYRTTPALRGRQAVLLNRDILRLFGDLHVSESFLLKNHISEILFKKPV